MTPSRPLAFIADRSRTRLTEATNHERHASRRLAFPTSDASIAAAALRVLYESAVNGPIKIIKLDVGTP